MRDDLIARMALELRIIRGKHGICLDLPVADVERVDALLLECAALTAQGEPAPALHAAAPSGHGCADCAIDGEPCPTCYAVAWRRRHPNVEQIVLGEAAAAPIPAAECRDGHIWQTVASNDGSTRYERCVVCYAVRVNQTIKVVLEPAP